MTSPNRISYIYTFVFFFRQTLFFFISSWFITPNYFPSNPLWMRLFYFVIYGTAASSIWLWQNENSNKFSVCDSSSGKLHSFLREREFQTLLSSLIGSGGLMCVVNMWLSTNVIHWHIPFEKQFSAWVSFNLFEINALTQFHLNLISWAIIVNEIENWFDFSRRKLLLSCGRTHSYV